MTEFDAGAARRGWAPALAVRTTAAGDVAAVP